MSTQGASSSSRLVLTISLCFAVALMEGLDLQAPGIAAQGILAEYGFDRLQMGWIFSAGIFGMLPGAFIGGRLADRYGRKIVLIGSVAMFGIFSLVTAHAPELYTLLLARFLTGVGLGASLPNLIAVASEAAGKSFRSTAVSMMYCGVPLGAALAALVGMFSEQTEWRLVFYIGGVVPLAIVALLALFLIETAKFAAKNSDEQPAQESVNSVLFRQNTLPTMTLWVSLFFTLMVTYILINWLPSLLVGQGYTGKQASMIVLTMQIGATLGTLALGYLTDRLAVWKMSMIIYIGMAISLVSLYASPTLALTMAAGFLAGIFTTGGQSVIYGLAPLYYPNTSRATGVGSAVAVGRIGAITGPLVAGKMLAMGLGVYGVFLACAPGIFLAAGSLCILSKVKKVSD
ncbi:3-(3-hydroxy-phenyl)propionate transporter MhpT [Pseudomonas sp. JBR1]|uniref:3-(3-hydroxy-phenyl)propionate transporter MhpT n=1 Tax=Pseudomonas sp. JBR1 TaxID=3020907 RepID=UPI00230666E5|nr:3-(3-hydroxy-phenyl)propionate transporter MhpT [Pseudomonas sp. JBR1]WCE09742.1 3-(3-hydroxy-phenyl)propionate transporter MhpT [Pseudomonas sp. JBR1]